MTSFFLSKSDYLSGELLGAVRSASLVVAAGEDVLVSEAAARNPTATAAAATGVSPFGTAANATGRIVRTSSASSEARPYDDDDGGGGGDEGEGDGDNRDDDEGRDGGDRIGRRSGRSSRRGSKTSLSLGSLAGAPLGGNGIGALSSYSPADAGAGGKRKGGGGGRIDGVSWRGQSLKKDEMSARHLH